MGDIKTEVAGLLDSGSDYVMFPKDIAKAVGIRLTGREQTASGVGGLKTRTLPIVILNGSASTVADLKPAQ